MARGGRRQPRDARGRFSSTGATARGGRIAKASGRRATVTARAKGAAPSGTIGRRPGKPSKPSAPANGIRPTGTLPRLQPASKIVPTNRRAQRRAPLGLKANAIRAFNPKTPQLGIGQLDRQMDRRIDKFDKELTKNMKRLKELKPRINKLGQQVERGNAQAIQDRFSKDKGRRFVAGIELNTIGSQIGAKAIKRRMQRAADAANRGSKPAARAREIYANQLAYMGPGKPKAAKNNLRPGPRNKQGPPKRTRKPRKPRA